MFYLIFTLVENGADLIISVILLRQNLNKEVIK